MAEIEWSVVEKRTLRNVVIETRASDGVIICALERIGRHGKNNAERAFLQHSRYNNWHQHHR